MAESKVIEGPAGFGPHGGPDGAEKLPTKNYPASSKIPYGPKTEIEGPCEKKTGYHK
jgi:hypothetical protein